MNLRNNDAIYLVFFRILNPELIPYDVNCMSYSLIVMVIEMKKAKREKVNKEKRVQTNRSSSFSIKGFHLNCVFCRVLVCIIK